MMDLWRRIRFFLNRRKREAELAEEMEFHRNLLGNERGMGNMTLAREDARAVWIAPWIESVWKDLGYAARALLRQRSFTGLALLALTLGIGLNVSLFTVVNALAFRPWPVRDPARVVNIFATWPRTGDVSGFSVAEFRYVNEHSRSLSGALLIRTERINLDQQRDGPRTHCEFVSGNYFSLLGVGMTLGRGFVPDEDRVEAPGAVAVLSYNTWRNRYNSDPAILGRQISIEDHPFTVIGVVSEDFRGTSPDPRDLWVPLATLPLARPNDPDSKKFLLDAHWCCSDLSGRLAAGVSRQQAAAELTTLITRFRASVGEQPRRVLVTSTALLARADSKVGVILPVFGMLTAAVTLILLLACANVSNLLLARAAGRQREIAVRLSLGAGRGRVVRQLLTESFLLAAVAAGLGVALGHALPGLIFRFLDEAPNLRFEIDSSVLLYSVVVAGIATVFFGLAPALGATRVSVSEAMKQQSPNASPRFGMRNLLLGAQVAISVVLLAGAALLVRGIQEAANHDLGFTVRGVMLVRVVLPASRYDATRAGERFASMAERIQPLTADGRVVISQLPPLGRARWGTSFQRPGEKKANQVLVQRASAEYFQVLGIPMRAGRGLDAHDVTHRLVVINEAMARRYWPGENPVGKTIVSGGNSEEIVGVVADAQIQSLGPVEPILFLPYSAVPHSSEVTLILRTAASGTEWTKTVTTLLAQEDPHAVVSVSTMSEQVDLWLGPSRLGAGVAAGLGLLALCLAAVGVYGVIAYSVEQRGREIGVRMALGARPGQVVGLMVRSNGRALAVGLGVGLTASFVVARLLRGFLYGVSAFDPLAYAEVLGILALAGAAAAVVPASRAARVDPVKALRYE